MSNSQIYEHPLPLSKRQVFHQQHLEGDWFQIRRSHHTGLQVWDQWNSNLQHTQGMVEDLKKIKYKQLMYVHKKISIITSMKCSVSKQIMQLFKDRKKNYTEVHYTHLL